MDRDHALRSFLAQREDLLGYLTAIVGAPQVAEDLLQDLAVLVLRKHAAIPDAEGAVAGWIRRAARFEARNRRRRDRRLVLGDAAVAAVTAAWEADPDPAPPDRRAALAGCIERLAPTARRLVDLRYGERLDCSAVAERLGVQLNTVYVGLTRVHRALADCLRRRLPELP